MSRIDVLIPTFNRPAAFAVTLTSLSAQTSRDFRVVISDQGDKDDSVETGVERAVIRVLRSHGNSVEFYNHLPRRGMAEQRQFPFDHVNAPCALFLDDDLILGPFVSERQFAAVQEKGCGFVRHRQTPRRGRLFFLEPTFAGTRRGGCPHATTRHGAVRRMRNHSVRSISPGTRHDCHGSARQRAACTWRVSPADLGEMNRRIGFVIVS